MQGTLVADGIVDYNAFIGGDLLVSMIAHNETGDTFDDASEWREKTPIILQRDANLGA